jgi:hypothetical protein
MKKPAKKKSAAKAKVAKKPAKVPAKKALKVAPKLAKLKEKVPAKAQAKVVEKPLKKGQVAPPPAVVTKGKGKAQAPQAVAKPEAEVVLTNADGKQYCRVHDCDSESTTDNYCRFHYLALWKRNKIKAKILQGGKLDKYIEDLTAKYPDKYLEMLRKDLTSEKDFNLIIQEMDMEDSAEETEAAEEDASRFIEEVRGGVPTTDDDEGSF